MNLTTTLNEWSARPELETRHNDFIELTESVLNARLHERHLEAFITYAMTPGSGSIALLTTAIEVLGVRVNGKAIEFRSHDEVIDARDRGSSTLIACIVGRSLEFSALSIGQAEVRQKTKITTVAGGGTNWVFVNFPNVYLFGCLVELFDFLRDTDQTAHYKTRFEEAIGLVNSSMTNKSTQQFARVRTVR